MFAIVDTVDEGVAFVVEVVESLFVDEDLLQTHNTMTTDNTMMTNAATPTPMPIDIAELLLFVDADDDDNKSLIITDEFEWSVVVVDKDEVDDDSTNGTDWPIVETVAVVFDCNDDEDEIKGAEVVSCSIEVVLDNANIVGGCAAIVVRDVVFFVVVFWIAVDVDVFGVCIGVGIGVGRG